MNLTASELNPAAHDAKVEKAYHTELQRCKEVLDRIQLKPEGLPADARALHGELLDAYAALQLHSGDSELAEAALYDSITRASGRELSVVQLRLASIRLTRLFNELENAKTDVRSSLDEQGSLLSQHKEFKMRSQAGGTLQRLGAENDRRRKQLEAAGVTQEVNVESAVHAQNAYLHVQQQLSHVQQRLEKYADVPDNVADAERKLQDLRNEYECLQMEMQHELGYGGQIEQSEEQHSGQHY